MHELERIWKESWWTEEIHENPVNIVPVPAEIQTEYLPNTGVYRTAAPTLSVNVILIRFLVLQYHNFAKFVRIYLLCLCVLSRDGVTIGGVWIGNWIY
jgi:hypothetical protein